MKDTELDKILQTLAALAAVGSYQDAGQQVIDKVSVEQAEAILSHYIAKSEVEEIIGKNELTDVQIVKLANLIAIKETERAIKELTNTMPHTDGMRHYNTVVKRISDLEQQLLKLREGK